jgi:hypothetical protein
MDENFCWFKLKINVSDAIRSDWHWNHSSNRDCQHISNLSNVFNQSWIDSMFEKGIVLQGALLFFKCSKFKNQFAHCDVLNFEPRIDCTNAINIVIGGENSEMIWYDLPDIKGMREKSAMSANALHEMWPIQILKEKERGKIQLNEITLVRTDLPHAVNVSDNSRICISVRTNRSHQSWADNIKYFQSKDLLELR